MDKEKEGSWKDSTQKYMSISIVQPPHFFAIYLRETVFFHFFYVYMLISEASAKYFIKAAVRRVIEKCRRGVKRSIHRMSMISWYSLLVHL